MGKRTWIIVASIVVLGVLAAACELSTIGGEDIPLDLECEQNEVLGFSGEAEDAEIVCLDPVDALTRAMRGLDTTPSEDAKECVTTERFYSDGTSEINAYGPGCPAGVEGTNHATIGGAEVPSDLDCYEDEVIAWAGDGLGCVHYEQITCEALTSESDAWRNGENADALVEAACGDYLTEEPSTDVSQCQSVTDQMRAINQAFDANPSGGMLSALGHVNDSVCDATPEQACGVVTASIERVLAFEAEEGVMTSDQNAAILAIVTDVCGPLP